MSHHTSSSRRPAACRLQVEVLEDRTVPSVNLVEAEPNNSPASAQVLARVLATDVIVDGSIVSPGDRDWFRLDLRAGDVVGVALTGQSGLDPALRLVDAGGNLLIANDNADFFGFTYLPPGSPLPRVHAKAKDAEVYYVVNTAGTYYLEARGSGDASTGKYKLDLVVARPGLESQPVGTRQVLFVDFDGASVNFSHFVGGEVSTGTRKLSELSSFLAGWGLTPADEDAVINATLATLRDRLGTDVRARGFNDNFDLAIRNSRDDADTFGKDPFVARLVIGGTRAETGLRSEGLAQYVDVGNFQTDDEAVVTLDWISAFRILELVPVQAPYGRADLLGRIIGQLAAHEVGHLFGGLHTDAVAGDPFAGVPDLMDWQLLVRTTLGPDLIFGTVDDVEVRLGVDAYDTRSPFRGTQDTLNTIAFGLSTGTQGATTQVELRFAQKRDGWLCAHSTLKIGSETELVETGDLLSFHRGGEKWPRRRSP